MVVKDTHPNRRRLRGQCDGDVYILYAIAKQTCNATRAVPVTDLLCILVINNTLVTKCNRITNYLSLRGNCYKLVISDYFKLEVDGRARREAARRRKSEWKVDLGIRSSSRSNGSWRMTT